MYFFKTGKEIKKEEKSKGESVKEQRDEVGEYNEKEIKEG